MDGPSSTRPAIPFGLLGLVVLVALLEHFEFRDNPKFATLLSASWRYKGRVVSKVNGREILCFGDSLVKFGVMPRVLKKQTGRTAFNLALHNGCAPTTYFLLRRALDAGNRPSVILVDFAWGQLKTGPSSDRSIYPWGVLLNPRESAELAWSARDPGLFAWVLLSQVLPSVRSRYEVRENLAAALKGESTGRGTVIPIFKKIWDINEGAHDAGLAITSREKAPPVVGPPLKSSWRSDPTNALYIRKFLELAARQNIPVFWLLPPVKPDYQAYMKHAGDEAAYTQFVREMQADYPGLTAIDARRSGFDEAVFMDLVHLNYDGAAAFSTRLGMLLRRHFEGLPDGSRWVALPSSDGRSPDTPAPTMASSVPPARAPARVQR